MPGPQVHVSSHDHLLGTTVEVRVAADDPALAALVDATVVAEVIRLQAVFSVYDETSELSRWRRGEVAVPGPELAEVLLAARDWQARSGGRFNPRAGALTDLWRQAVITGTPPDAEHLAEVAASIAAPAVGLVAGVPVPAGDAAAFQLNAIAKGWIVDRALGAARAVAPATTSVAVNAGGDLAHTGTGALRVGIENPLRPYDNEPPLAVVEIGNAALATSGRARRGFRVGSTWFGHVIDPRSGWPVDAIASISVVASSAMLADVIATVAGVLDPVGAVDDLSARSAVEGLVVAADGTRLATEGWADLVVN